MKFKHIAFDVWGTILKGNSAYASARAEIIQTIWLPERSTDEIKKVFADCKQLFDTHEYVSGLSVPYDFKQIMLVRELGLPLETIKDPRWKSLFIDLFLKHMPTLMHNDIPNLINDYGESGYTMSIISNTHFIRGVTMRKALFNLDIDTSSFDWSFFSDELGVCKPHQQLFSMITDMVGNAYGITPEECIMIGNDQVLDIAPAELAGWQTHLIESGESWLKLREQLDEVNSTRV